MRPAVALVLTTIIGLGGWGGNFPAAVAQEDWGGLPPGDGREDVYNTCQACHSLAIVRQQRLSRAVWTKTLAWMVAEQGMPEPEPEEYARILDYLGTSLGSDTPR